MPLSSAMDTDTVTNISSYAGIVLMASLFGRLVTHLHQPNPDNRPQNLANGEFWKRHRKMDSIFSNILMLLPDHLRISSRVKDCNVYFLNLSMHALTISLHQAAVAKAEMYGLDPSVVRQSQGRSDAAAEEIVRIMRLAALANIQKVSILPPRLDEPVIGGLRAMSLDASFSHFLSPPDCRKFYKKWQGLNA